MTTISEQLKAMLHLKKNNAYYAKRLKISEKEVEGIRKQLRINKEETFDNEREVDNENGSLKSTVWTDHEPKDDEELALLHKVNLDKYIIANYYSKYRNGRYGSTVFCKLKTVTGSLKEQKEAILSELKKELPIIPYFKEKLKNKDVKYAYEINIPDIHFGKLSWAEESGEDYDLKIAEQRYSDAISNLLSLVDTSKIERIVFPIGNDMLNIDSRKNETFAGTRQDSDSRFFKIVKTVKDILIRNINSLSLIAPVDVIVISGNHDPESMFMIGEILDAYYTHNPNVSIDNSPKQRKYYQYGKNGMQYTHGNEEKHSDLGLIFATEQKELWAATDFRFAKLGHFHKNKKTSYMSIDEYQGFQVQVLPSLSGSDAWHNSKGYMSKKQAKGFLYDKIKGQIAEFTYSA